MKKNIVLTTLFILPILIFFYFYFSVNNYVKLPIITTNVPEINYKWETLNRKKVVLENKITVLSFSGYKILENRANYYDICQKIYVPYRAFRGFQFVIISPKGTEEQVKILLKRLNNIENISGYNFVFADPNEIKQYYKSLRLKNKLDKDLGTPMVFIIDKGKNLRGRKGKDLKGKNEYKEGYNSSKLSELYNEMTDDIRVLTHEYRLKRKNHEE